MNLNNFISELKKINIEITDIQLEQLNKYYELLVEYNKVMNLTGITEKDQVYLKHFYDSLTLTKVIDPTKEETLCDVGTGAGFPGLVIKILFPNLKVTLVDSLNKRIEFLKTVIRELNLKDIEAIHKRILNIINQVIGTKNILLKDIDIVTVEEKEKLLRKFNETEVVYDKDATVIELVENKVLEFPDKVALISNGKKLTYKELNERANMLARKMISAGIQSKDIIGIMLNRSPEMIIGLIAILKCGATYLPIDPEYPQDRITYMLENSETKLVLVNSQTQKHILEKCNTINVDSEDKETYSKENINLKLDANTLAYLIYTSGSTGQPKGVMVTNRNLNNFVKGMKEIIEFVPNKNMVSVTTVCFDIFGLEMWCTLTSGMTLVLANENEQNMPALLNKLCLENNVNMIQTTPSRFSTIFENKENLEFVKNITFAVK